jgi:Holliday junction resolvase RusA-like endonuclease
VKPWRDTIVRQMGGLSESGPPLEAASVRLDFVMPRPKALSPRRITPLATKRPDIDKLARAVLDALTTAALIADDSVIVELHCTKRIAEPGEESGCRILVSPILKP